MRFRRTFGFGDEIWKEGPAVHLVRDKSGFQVVVQWDLKSVKRRFWSRNLVIVVDKVSFGILLIPVIESLYEGHLYQMSKPERKALLLIHSTRRQAKPPSRFVSRR
ncbi:uncharacterized protein LOC120089383 [Benincasa hispida]|uniref:uncharacterized protein LOC120089383 n=1 Tax=Benincasa hispida TaxID=102211 RepID=UPI0019011D1C|nr:uncharacterized protein LOC120089383 [Benincasa hispida]